MPIAGNQQETRSSMFSSAFGEALNLIGTADAKSDFFLTPADLRFLNVRTIGGGLGCGAPMKFYEPSELRVAAIRKYGEAGFQKKLESRQKRESNKRRREDEADRALAVLHQTARAPTSKRLQPPSDGSRAQPIHVDSDDDTPPTAPRWSTLHLRKQPHCANPCSIQQRRP